jgi:hypothetical protein
MLRVVLGHDKCRRTRVNLLLQRGTGRALGLPRHDLRRASSSTVRSRRGGRRVKRLVGNRDAGPNPDESDGEAKKRSVSTTAPR